MKNTVILTLLLLLLSSCSYVSDLKRTGEDISKELSWNGAADIEIWASVRLIPISSNESKIELRGMDYIVNDYEFIQSDNKLIVKHNNPERLQENKIADLLLYAPDFRNFTFNAPCKLYCNNALRFNTMNIIVNGKGTFTTSDLVLEGNRLNLTVFGEINKSNHTLSGNVDFVNYYIEGSTNIKAANLSTKETVITHKSIGDCYVSVSELLEVYIYSTGNVYYSGSPEIHFEQVQNSLMNAEGKLINY